VLANLTLLNDKTNYDSFAKRLEMVFIDPVLNDAIPLTYSKRESSCWLQGVAL